MKNITKYLLMFILFTSIFEISNIDVSAKNGLAPAVEFKTTSSINSTTLSWDKVKNATGYIVYYKTSKGTYKKLKKTKNTKSTHYNLKNNNKYYYKVKSYTINKNKTYYSKYSKTVLIKTKDIKVPSKFNTSSKAYSLEMNWDKVSGVNGYEVYMKNDDGDFDKIHKTADNSFIIKNLDSETTYSFRIRSYVDKNGKTYYSKYSKTVSIKTGTIPPRAELFTLVDEDEGSYRTSVKIKFKNTGDLPIVIENKGNLTNKDYPKFNRYLHIEDKKDITIDPHTEKEITYIIEDSKTWYNNYTILIIIFSYEGREYLYYINSSLNKNYPQSVDK